MNTVTLHFRAEGQKLIPLDGIYKYASNTVEYIRAVVDLGDDWTDFDVVRAAWFTDYDCIVTVLDPDGVCMVPAEVLNKRAEVCVNLFGCDVVQDELVDRLTTYPVKAVLIDANARVCGSETAPVTPSQFEQFIAIVEETVHSVKDIDHTELNADYTLTIYYTDGTSDTVGPIRGEQGPVGPTGNGISKIEKVGTAGLVDTYRITYTKGQTYEYTVTNGAKGETGNGIESIYLTGTSGAVKTYTILFTDGNTFEYNVTDGEVTFATLEQLMPKDTASGDIASFPDGQAVFPLKSCLVDIDPVQDLHGYDTPWVGGAGKNKFDKDYLSDFSNYTQPISGYRYTDKIQLKPNTNYIIKAKDITAMSTGLYYVLYHVAGADPDAIAPTSSTLIYPVYNGTPSMSAYQTFTTGETGVIRFAITNATNLAEVMTTDWQLEEGSTATPWQPYSNICPITGWTGCDLFVRGVNQWDEETQTGYYSGTTGAYASDPIQICSVNPIPVQPSTSYYIKTPSALRLCYYKEDMTFISAENKKDQVITTPAECKFVHINTFASPAYPSGTTYNHDISLNYPSTDHDYHAYQGTTYNITWQTEAGTVYGGTDEVVSGTLTDKMQSIDLGDYTWSVSSAFTGMFYTTGLRSDLDPNGTLMCSHYKKVNGIQATDDSAFAVDVAGTLYIRDTRYDGYTGAQFKSAMSGVQFVYEKATPTTYQLTGQQIACLLGQNNIFANCGAVAVLYIADIGLYIDKKTS